jgi:hypothetical protein
MACHAFNNSLVLSAQLGAGAPQLQAASAASAATSASLALMGAAILVPGCWLLVRHGLPPRAVDRRVTS